MKINKYLFVRDKLSVFQARIYENLELFEVECPECSGQLILKECGCSAFFGCENAPRCEVVMPINRMLLTAIVGSFVELERGNDRLRTIWS